MLIKKAGHHPTMASNGKEALEAYNNSSFDVIFMVNSPTFVMLSLGLSTNGSHTVLISLSLSLH